MKILSTFFALSVFLGVYGQTTITLQPDSVTGKDAMVGSYPNDLNTNIGNHIHLLASAWTVSGSPGVRRGLLQFDLSGIPAGASIVEAKLSLYHSSMQPNEGHTDRSGSNDWVIQRITSNWDEQTVTWNNQPNSTTQNQILLPGCTGCWPVYSTSDYLNINVDTIVQYWVDNPSENFGFIMKLQTEQFYRAMKFASSDHPDASLHPKLEVTYLTRAEQCLVADYPFNGNANDASGNGHHATVYGATLTADRFGNPNSAYDFDGSDDYINTFTTFDYPFRTVSVWAMPRDISGSGLVNPDIVFTQSDAALNYGKVYAGFSNDTLKMKAGGEPSNFSYTQIGVNIWYHIVLVRNSVETKYYLNGQQIGVGVSGNSGANVDPYDKLVIGTDRTRARKFFDGVIDDLKIFDCALDSNDIVDLYNSGAICTHYDTVTITVDDTVVHTTYDTVTVFDSISVVHTTYDTVTVV